MLNMLKSTKIPEMTATRFNRREYQLMKKNHFEILFGHNDKISIDKDLQFMVTSISLPKESTESNDINYFNQTVKVAGKTTFDTTPIILKDSVDYDTELKFFAWRREVYNPETARAGIAADYKVDAVVFEYTPNGEYFRKWKYIGCWPSAVEYGDLTHDDGGNKEISVTLNYDYAYRVLTGDNETV